MSDYTPTTEGIRRQYVFGVANETFTWGDAEKWFDRWLAEVKAQAVHDFVESAVKPEKIMESVATGFNESVRELMAQVWEEAYMTGVSDVIADKGATMNPYQQGETE